MGERVADKSIRKKQGVVSNAYDPLVMESGYFAKDPRNGGQGGAPPAMAAKAAPNKARKRQRAVARTFTSEQASRAAPWAERSGSGKNEKCLLWRTKHSGVSKGVASDLEIGATSNGPGNGGAVAPVAVKIRIEHDFLSLRGFEILLGLECHAESIRGNHCLPAQIRQAVG